MEGDELDVTLPQGLNPPQTSDPTQAAVATLVENPGWTVLQKLIIFGLIAGGVTICLRSRKGRVSGEKSLA